jgi:hypothetical protein
LKRIVRRHRACCPTDAQIPRLKGSPRSREAESSDLELAQCRIGDIPCRRATRSSGSPAWHLVGVRIRQWVDGLHDKEAELRLRFVLFGSSHYLGT